MLNKIDEYEAQYARIREAGVKTKGGYAGLDAWMIDAVFTDADGIGDLMTLTSVEDVDVFLGSWCPECWRLDRRRSRGGPCRDCRKG